MKSFAFHIVNFYRIACCCSTSRSINSNTDSSHASKTMGGATPASQACIQRSTHKHQKSPSLRPGKPNSGLGDVKSFPFSLVKDRNAFDIFAHTVCRPLSRGVAWQNPSRRKPVFSLQLQTFNTDPTTLRPNPFH